MKLCNFVILTLRTSKHGVYCSYTLVAIFNSNFFLKMYITINLMLLLLQAVVKVHFNAFLQHPHLLEGAPHQLNHYIIHPCHNGTKTLLRGEHSDVPSHYNDYTIVNRFPGQLTPSLTLTL